MPTKLIRLNDDILVEVEVPEDQAQQISGGLAEQVDASLDRIQPMLVRMARPISAAWEEINKEIRVEKAVIEVGFSFEAGGDIFVAKVKGQAALSVSLELRPVQEKKS